MTGPGSGVRSPQDWGQILGLGAHLGLGLGEVGPEAMGSDQARGRGRAEIGLRLLTRDNGECFRGALACRVRTGYCGSGCSRSQGEMR